jgi:hypothetical protein
VVVPFRSPPGVVISKLAISDFYRSSFEGLRIIEGSFRRWRGEGRSLKRASELKKARGN